MTSLSLLPSLSALVSQQGLLINAMNDFPIKLRYNLGSLTTSEIISGEVPRSTQPTCHPC